MNLIGQKVFHKAFNKTGIVVNQFTQSTYEFIEVQFDDGRKPFSYPSVFTENLKCENANLQAEIMAEVRAKTEAAKIQAQRKNIPVRPATPQFKRQTAKLDEKTNIVFKCNFCNGGKAQNGIGFLGPCSDGIIRYNIETAKHSWCSCEESPCYLYHKGIIDRNELDNYYNKQGTPVCYESQMLSHWTARAGFSLKGESKRIPKKLKDAKRNSVAILTTREPNDTEDNRIIFGVFWVDDFSVGNENGEGFVQCNSKYKLGLTLSEARQVLFWKHYQNDDSNKKPDWRRHLFKYTTNEVTAKILKAIYEIKIGTPDESLAREFFLYYCTTHGIDSDKY